MVSITEFFLTNQDYEKVFFAIFFTAKFSVCTKA